LGNVAHRAYFFCGGVQLSPARVFVILENLADDFVDGECVRAGNLDRTLYRFGDGRLGDRSRDIF
jgi:hypothetical protein